MTTKERIERLNTMTPSRWLEIGKLSNDIGVGTCIEDLDLDEETENDLIARFPLLSRNYEPSYPDPSLVL